MTYGHRLRQWFGVTLLAATLLTAACDDEPENKQATPQPQGTPTPLAIPATPPEPEEVPPATELELQAMRGLLETSVSILNEYWSKQFGERYRSVRSSDGSYISPNAVYTSLEA